LKFGSRHSDREGPAAINPEVAVTPGLVGVVVVVVVPGGVVVDVDVVVVVDGVVVDVVVITPPPPPSPPPKAEVVDVAPLPLGTTVTAVVLIVGVVGSVIVEGTVIGDQYLVRLAKRLLPNQYV